MTRNAALLAGALLVLGGISLSRARSTRAARTEPDALPPLDTAAIYRLVEGKASLDEVPPGALPEAPAPVGVDDIPAPEGYAVDFKHYPTTDEIATFLGQMERDYPELVEPLSIGTTWQDRSIIGARVTNEKGVQPIEDRPAMYIDGQHHARELISNEVVLYTFWYLVHFYGADPFVTHLLDTRVVYFIPTVNVDGNVIALADSQDARKTANPSSSDDDNDGRFDEDPSIGFGYGTHTLRLYRFDPAWADAHPNDPFVGGWQSSLQGNPQVLGRFTGALGGPMEQIPEIDADRDGRVHEDEIGGVDPNRNYDAHWARTTDTSDETYGGPRVWSEPESKAVRDFVAELPTLATGLSYHSGVDVILHPWGWSANADLPDAGIYELLSRKGTQLTEANGFPGSPHTWTAQGLYPARGSTMDYLYESRGVMAWSPEVYGSSNTSYIARVGATNAYTVGTSTGFAFNPRPETILASTDRWNRFALYLLAATPNLEVNAVYVDAGDLVVVIGNDGLLPVAVQPVFTGPGDTSRPLEPRLLQATNTVWRIPLMGLGDGPFTLSADAELQVGTMPHKVETLRASFHLEDGAVVLDDGEVRPFIDLAATIPEGWFAGDEWDVGPYHRGQPIPATPPSIPTPFEPPASTPMPTDTPTATAPPTATPTATESPTPRPAPVYLPQALQNSRPAAR